MTKIYEFTGERCVDLGLTDVGDDAARQYGAEWLPKAEGDDGLRKGALVTANTGGELRQGDIIMDVEDSWSGSKPVMVGVFGPNGMQDIMAGSDRLNVWRNHKAVTVDVTLHNDVTLREVCESIVRLSRRLSTATFVDTTPEGHIIVDLGWHGSRGSTLRTINGWPSPSPVPQQYAETLDSFYSSLKWTLDKQWFVLGGKDHVRRAAVTEYLRTAEVVVFAPREAADKAKPIMRYLTESGSACVLKDGSALVMNGFNLEMCYRDVHERAGSAPVERADVSKRLRFEILKRDGYTCRYCGNTPVQCPLHVDHVIPASKGGTSDPENLVTSCADCNLGKSNIGLTESRLPQARTPEQLLEQAEQINAYLTACKELDGAKNQVREFITGKWADAVGRSIPPEFETRLVNVVSQHGLLACIEAIAIVAERGLTGVNARKYFNGVVRRMVERDGVSR